MMATVHSAAALWRSDKAVNLTGHSRHRHTPMPVSAHFVAPDVASQLVFGPAALAASIARTSTLRGAPAEMLLRWRDKALAELEYLVLDGPVFELSPLVRHLADLERTSFSGAVGAGIADLCMNAVGYVWRDNAVCLSNALQPHADFIYGGGPADGHGAVLAEAHGTFAGKASANGTKAQASRKYRRQVRPYLGRVSTHGTIVHGYAIAFGSRLGTAGAFLGIAETLLPKGTRSRPRRPSKPPVPTQSRTSQSVPTSLVLSTYRSNFLLTNALRVVAWIDWLRDSGEPPSGSPQIFLRFAHQGRFFLVGVDPVQPGYWFEKYENELRHKELRVDCWPGDHLRGLFAIEESIGELVLNALTQMIGVGNASSSQQVELSALEPVGLFMRGGRRTEDLPSALPFALFRDGLAYFLRDFPERLIGARVWDPKRGFIQAH